MKKDLTELVFILDKSGSMSGLEKDTIGGFNSLIEKQRKETGEAIVSTILLSIKLPNPIAFSLTKVFPLWLLIKFLISSQKIEGLNGC